MLRLALLLLLAAGQAYPRAGNAKEHSARAASQAGPCRDRLATCKQLLDAGTHTCAQDFCAACGNSRRRCDVTCGFCSGLAGASRAASTAAQLEAATRGQAPAVMPPVRSCFSTRLDELPQIREHRCEGAASGANACFINLALKLAGCCFAPGTAPRDRPSLECNPAHDGRICHSRACNTPVAMEPLRDSSQLGEDARPVVYQLADVLPPDMPPAVTAPGAEGGKGGARGYAAHVAAAALLRSDVRQAARAEAATNAASARAANAAATRSIASTTLEPAAAAPSPSPWVRKKVLPQDEWRGVHATADATLKAQGGLRWEAERLREAEDSQPASTTTDDVDAAGEGSMSPRAQAVACFAGVVVGRCVFVKLSRKRRERQSSLLPMKVEGHRH